MTKTDRGRRPGKLVLAARLDFAACETLHDEIAKARGAGLTLDAGKVTFLGGLALDILLRARAEWLAAGHAFALINPSEDVYEGLKVLGVAPVVLIHGAPAEVPV